MKNANFRTIFEDLKISFKFAVKNIISYLLAIFGVLIVSTVLIAIVGALIFIPIFFVIGGFENLVTYFESFGSTSDIGVSNIALGSILFGLPFLAPTFVAFGAMFGMGREIVESEGTSAEGVFIWYKKKFFSLAGGGMILFLFVLGPLILALVGGISLYGEQFLMMRLMHAGPVGIVNPIVIGLLLIWFAISTGLLSMLFPSIIDGYSVFESTKRSIRMSIKYFDRVFGVWMTFLLILGSVFLPIIAAPFAVGIGLLGFGIMMVYMLPAMLFLVFVFLPAMTIGLTRVYMIVTAEDYEHAPEDEESGPSFIGGV